jgi:hypothetical protein
VTRRAILGLAGIALLLSLFALVLAAVSAPSSCGDTPRGDRIAWDLGYAAGGVILASVLVTVAVAIAKGRDRSTLVAAGTAFAIAVGAFVADYYALTYAFDLCFQWNL